MTGAADVATERERKREAVVRLMRIAAEVQRDGIKVDGRDPGWRALCKSPELAAMSEEQMRERLINLALVATELEC
jgi:hypothetical protein